MLVLAIDTSTKIGTAALYSDEVGTVAEIVLNCGNNHSENIMPAIDRLFEISKIPTSKVDKIAVSIGPGSFTGIRIGVAVAKGLAYSLKKPIVGINELDLIGNLAGGNLEGRKIISMIDARKERVYYAVYSTFNNNLTLESEYLDGEVREIVERYKEDKTLFLGDGAINYKEIIQELAGENAIFLSRALSIPRASVLAELAIARNREDNLITLEPFYISKSQAEREIKG